LHMMAQVSDLKAGELIHVIADAHIYDRHEAIVEELIARPRYPAPVFRMNPAVKDFYDFTLEDFAFENYQAGSQVTGIPVAV
ncbi:MAG TPA: thymidylate synthase, partial [Clostridiales bacterium]|nr:thymidylate synthase [Clostridiales bacterium]